MAPRYSFAITGMQGQRIGPITVLNTIQTSTTKPTGQHTQAYGMSLRFPQLCSHHNRAHIQHLQIFTTKPTVQHTQAYGMSNRFPTCEPTTIGYPFFYFILFLQADRGFAAVAFFGGAEGAVLKKRVLRSMGYGFPRRKKSSASLQYCKY